MASVIRACRISLLVAVFSLSTGLAAQQSYMQDSPADATASVSSSAGSSSAGQRLVRFNGHALDAAGQPLTGLAGVTFAIYEEQNGGAPLWQETQNLATDASGRFSALLGKTNPAGVPAELFSGSQSRWLAVLPHAPGVSEQPRILLVSVPYALQAADSEMLGGKPASEYMMKSQGATPVSCSEAGTQANVMSAASIALQSAATPAISVSGASVGYLPVFTDPAGDLANSLVSQAGGNVGIGTSSPSSLLTVAAQGKPSVIQLGSNATGHTTGLIETSADTGGYFFLQGVGTQGASWGALALQPLGGYVGVGNTTPNGKLDVGGKFAGMIVSGANLDPAGNFPLTPLQNSGSILEGWNRTAGGGEIDLISNRGPGGTGGFAFYDYTNGGSLNSLVTFQGNGRVGIGTTAPDQALTVAGAIHSTSGGFVFPDGSVLSSANPLSGGQSGNVILTAGNGIPASGNLEFQTAGNSTNTVSNRLLIAGAPKAMTGSVPIANLFSMHIAQGDAAGGRVKFTIVASDGSHYAMETGEMIYLASPQQMTCAMVISQYSPAPPAYTNTTLAIPAIGQIGALNAQCSTTSFGSDPGVQIFDTAPTTFTATTHKVYYTIENQSQSAITLQP